MSTDQGTLLGSACRKCNAAIPYCGHGRKRSLCDSCYPAEYPARKAATNVPRARRSDPSTSAEAAASVNGAAIEQRILEAFDQFGWLTADECVDVLDGAFPPTVKSAISRLAKSKPPSLVNTGTRRPSSRGRASTVWGLADA